MIINELITDRTSSDVAQVISILRKYYTAPSTLTAEEIAIFSTDMKGAYNASDANRVATLANLISYVLAENMSGQTVQNFFAEYTENDANVEGDEGFELVLEYLEDLAPITYGGTVSLSLDSMTYDHANLIEETAQKIYTWIDNAYGIPGYEEITTESGDAITAEDGTELFTEA